ncbi:MAG: hypothetical protein JWO59_922 [Chloroflexi bacterium]|nr:hypothetical protein [Chloroflexota bacterium]
MRQRIVATYSLAACDPANGDLGVVVQSKFLAVGAVVPWAIAGVGAVATQARANPTFGPDGLRLLQQGATAQEALDRLVAADDGRDHRQVGLVDARGNAATYTGSGCFSWAGGRTGHGYTAQGNILVSQATVDALAETFEVTGGSLADRLIAALAAAQAAGGDSRGMQSAAILVVRERGGYCGFNDQYIDLRVDDHPAPIDELTRIMRLHTLYLEPTAEGTALAVTADLTREIQSMLAAAGDYRNPVTGIYDEATATAMAAYAGRENLEMREGSATWIDPLVLQYMRDNNR